VIASIIRRGINAFDNSVADLELISKDSESDEPDSEGSKYLQRITVGSSLPVTNLAELERAHGDDEAWRGLRKKIGKAFTGYFSYHITFNSHDEVCK
jgi:hypothetical protein